MNMFLIVRIELRLVEIYRLFKLFIQIALLFRGLNHIEE